DFYCAIGHSSGDYIF
nr:immunoglobulin light chain junction region [Macaca mulatta]